MFTFFELMVRQFAINRFLEKLQNHCFSLTISLNLWLRFDSPGPVARKNDFLNLLRPVAASHFLPHHHPSVLMVTVPVELSWCMRQRNRNYYQKITAWHTIIMKCSGARYPSSNIFQGARAGSVVAFSVLYLSGV